MTVAFERPAWSAADVIRESGAEFLQTHGGLTGSQRQALSDLARCRTAALGGHVHYCRDCGRDCIAYNSCRNRHCPTCQASARARWLEREAKFLLPVEYFHVVFTLPAGIAELAHANPTAMYELLFSAASATLREVAANPKRLGASVGVLMVLHTWGQNLHHHPHVHCVVTGGGLSCDGRGRIDTTSPKWLSCRPGFFLPVRVLSRVFRAKYRDGLRRLFDDGRLMLPERLRDPVAFASWLTSPDVIDVPPRCVNSNTNRLASGFAVGCPPSALRKASRGQNVMRGPPPLPAATSRSGLPSPLTSAIAGRPPSFSL